MESPRSLENKIKQAQERLLSSVIDYYCEARRPAVSRKLGLEFELLFSKIPGAKTPQREEIKKTLMGKLWEREYQYAYPKSLNDQEKFLKAIGQRDHYTHQFEVFVLGWNFLHAINGGKTDGVLAGFDFHSLSRLWLLTALAHDWGLPVGKMSNIIKNFSKAYEGVMDQDVQVLFKTLIVGRKILKPTTKSLHDGLIATGIKDALFESDDDVSKLLKRLKGRSDHGYLGAKVFAETFLSGAWGAPLGGKSISDRELQLIITALALHNLKAEKDEWHIRRISFTRNPLAYILYITDNLQEWFRLPDPEKNYPLFHLTSFHHDYGKSIQLNILLEHHDWTSKLVEGQIKYLQKQKSALEILEGSGQEIMLAVHYECGAPSNMCQELTINRHL